MNTISNLVPFKQWLDEMDISPTTGWRWRKQGLIKSITINGRVYITKQAVRAFEKQFTKDVLANLEEHKDEYFK
jgi:predicted site-specific integrase-resolvase